MLIGTFIIVISAPKFDVKKDDAVYASIYAVLGLIADRYYIRPKPRSHSHPSRRIYFLRRTFRSNCRSRDLLPSVPYRDKKYYRSASLRRTGSSRDRPHWVPLCRLLLRNRMHFTDSGAPARKVPLPRTAAGIRTQSRPVCFFDIIDKKNRSKRVGYSRLFRRLFRDSVFL